MTLKHETTLSCLLLLHMGVYDLLLINIDYANNPVLFGIWNCFPGLVYGSIRYCTARRDNPR